ncbi:MAG: sugar transferase [Christensenellales bacterium]
MKRKETLYEKYIKRFLDVFLSSFAIIALSPLLAVVALAVKIKLGSPVFFSQARPGKFGEIFVLKKFRTMTDEPDPLTGELLPDEQRLTRFGCFLRSTSLDELPELFNILKGDMSIVGPRPLLVKYLHRYNEKQMHRHDVRPGLTGFAQANGRNAISWEEKFDMDVYYTEHISFLFDLKVILQTVKAVICRDGINSDTCATMEEFMGTPEEIH